MKIKQKVLPALKIFQMKILITTCIFLCIFLPGVSQNADKKLRNQCDFYELFEKYYTSHKPSGIDTLCMQSVSFIRFRVQNSKSVSLEYSDETPAVIKTLMSDFLHSILPLLKNKDDLLQAFISSGKDILLPVHYTFFSGVCQIKKKYTNAINGLLTFSEQNATKPSFPGNSNEPFFQGVLMKPIIINSPGN